MSFKIEKKIVFVNNTAAVSGGALSILIQFIETVCKKNNDFIFYIFCTANLKSYECENIKIINNGGVKSWENRILWDFYGMKKWSKKTNISPNLIISLQNTGVYGFNVPQLVYIHQAIPFNKYNWNLFNKSERVYWMYKHIYIYIIAFTLKISKSKAVVQTNWMKEKVKKRLKLREKDIYVIRPKCFLDVEDEKSNININKNEFNMFYPAIAAKYKNHEVLAKSLNLIKTENIEIYDKMKVYLTIKESDNIEFTKLINKLNINEKFVFLDKISKSDVKHMYKECDLVLFPSFIETIGLPIIESSQVNSNIIVADLDYAHELIHESKNVLFANPNNEEEWKLKILYMYNIRPNGMSKMKFNTSGDWDKLSRLIQKLT